jgi:long-chain acyl-CoA synthetase
MPVETLNDIYLETSKIPRECAMKVKRNGAWVDIPLTQFVEEVSYLSTGLRVLGVKSGDRVAILSENRPAWAISDFATLAAGAVTVPVYPTLLARQIQYIIDDSGSMVILVSTAEQLDKILEIRHITPSVHTVVVFDPPPSLPEGVQR